MTTTSDFGLIMVGLVSVRVMVLIYVEMLGGRVPGEAPCGRKGLKEKQ